MIPELLGRLIWRAGKMAVRYVVIPMAVTAATAYVLQDVADRVERKSGQTRLDPLIRPAV